MKKDKEDLILKCQLMLLSMIEEEVVIPLINMETYMNISKYKDECVEKLFELTNKETPVTPISRELENIVEDGWITIATSHCQRCGYDNLMPVHNYCSWCGQKLDWSDND